MTYEYPPTGTVIYGSIVGGPFLQAKAKPRPLVCLNDFGFLVPLTSTGQDCTIWINDTRTNGLVKPSGVIHNQRALLMPGSDYRIAGRMSTTEMAVINKAISRFGYEATYDVH